jgi:hypothetical protein
MLGQAGHETGWGKSEINKDGSNSFNLFGIKAGKGWTGKVAEVTTTEYINGAPRKVTAKFRAYDSYEESFRDYARLIKESPRYEKAESVAKTARPWPTQPSCRRRATPPIPSTPESSAAPSRARCAPWRYETPHVATPSPLSQRCALREDAPSTAGRPLRGLWPGLRPQYAAQAARHGT